MKKATGDNKEKKIEDKTMIGGACEKPGSAFFIKKKENRYDFISACVKNLCRRGKGGK